MKLFFLFLAFLFIPLAPANAIINIETIRAKKKDSGLSSALAFAESAVSTPILLGELDVVVSIQAAFDIERPAS